MDIKRKFKPESLMMSYGYNPGWSEGAIKCPIFQTSTFVFKTAEEGKSFFELAYGLRSPEREEQMGLIYSRINNPDLEILENRLCLWDDAEDCAVFESGMSAITTAMLEFLKPGDALLFTSPLYGGTHHFIRKILPLWQIESYEIYPDQSKEEILETIKHLGWEKKVKMIFVETPANPTNNLFDLEELAELAAILGEKSARPVIAVDNTYLGPLWQHPLKHGADLVLYSATKYIGGHSDVIAGACLGSKELVKRIKGLRTFLGNMAGPWTGWLLLRSLETLKVRMERQAENAAKIADFLKEHPKIQKVMYLGHLKPEDGKIYEIYKKQCLSPGAMLGFEIKGGEKEAYKFLNSLELIKLAVSLGSTESLAQHPATMTHIDVDEEEKLKIGITPSLIRMSVGVEDPGDLIDDIQHALEMV
ncbi:MAG: methionine gamma-lyase [Vicingaceae bacterium]|nr:MAG: methionine gamma-lyase [Vicingaceae bacterium]